MLNYLNCPHHTCLEPGAWSLGLLIQGLVGTSKRDIYIYIIRFSFSGFGAPRQAGMCGGNDQILMRPSSVKVKNIIVLLLSSFTWMTEKISADKDQLW